MHWLIYFLTSHFLFSCLPSSFFLVLSSFFPYHSLPPSPSPSFPSFLFFLLTSCLLSSPPLLPYVRASLLNNLFLLTLSTFSIPSYLPHITYSLRFPSFSFLPFFFLPPFPSWRKTCYRCIPLWWRGSILFPELQEGYRNIGERRKTQKENGAIVEGPTTQGATQMA